MGEASFARATHWLTVPANWKCANSSLTRSFGLPTNVYIHWNGMTCEFNQIKEKRQGNASAFLALAQTQNCTRKAATFSKDQTNLDVLGQCLVTDQPTGTRTFIGLLHAMAATDRNKGWTCAAFFQQTLFFIERFIGQEVGATSGICFPWEYWQRELASSK